MGTVDALFGSKTRVKLLHLFMSNPEKSFYVREITRLVDEQINSVRRELANLLDVGVIDNDSADNKLYYQVNQSYEHYVPFRQIFAAGVDAGQSTATKKNTKDTKWQAALQRLPGLRIAVSAGMLVRGSGSPIDLLLVGNVSPKKAKSLAGVIEKEVGNDLNYSVISYDEFYYRLSVRDKFITEILSSQHDVLVDPDKILERQN